MAVTRHKNSRNFLVSMLKDEKLQPELFRLIVDGKYHCNEQGCFGYESRQPGSVYNALNAMLTTQLALEAYLPLTLTVPLYKEIHRLCRENIKQIDKEIKGGEFAATTQVQMGLRHLTLDGLKDLITFAQKYPELKVSISMLLGGFEYHEKQLAYANAFTLLNIIKTGLSATEENHFSYQVNLDAVVSERITKKILENCNQALSKAQRDDDVLTAIVDCVYELEHLHPYLDVNLRSNIVLINLVLDYFGLPPVCYFDPNYLDGGSKAEFFNAIKQGMLKTLDILKNPGKEHFNFSVNGLTPVQLDWQKKIIQPLVERANLLPGDPFEKDEIERLEARIEAIKSKTSSPVVIDEARLKPEGIDAALKANVIMPSQPMFGLSFTNFNYSRAKLDNGFTSFSRPRSTVTRRRLTTCEEEDKAIYSEELNKYISRYSAGEIDMDTFETMMRALGNSDAELFKDTGITLATLAEELGAPDELIRRLMRPRRQVS